MIYPEFIKVGDTIGVTAPANGITKPEKVKRLDYAIKNFKNKGFNIMETANVRTGDKGRSSSSKTQAKELESLYLNYDVKMIICAAGGEFAMEMLPEFNFEVVKNNPKWLQGYSNPTCLTFTITTNYDIATIYGTNFAAFGMTPWHKSLEDNFQILQGNIITQNSYPKYESGHTKYIIGHEPYLLDKKVKWENLNDEDIIEMQGRIIGGCIEDLSELAGTPFDKTLDFIERYQEDGVIWYFDNFGLTSESIIRTLWKFKIMGWFKYTKGIIFGRNFAEVSYCDISFKEALKHALNELNIPVIINADIGHVSPRMTIINGAIAHVECKNGKGSIQFILK